MSIGSVLLRLLLSLCLVLNGTAAAAASAQLPMAQHTNPATAEAAHQGTSTEAMPCHGHHDAMAAAMPGDASMHGIPMQHAPAANTPQPTKPKHTPDCCKSGTCRCACVHIAQVGVPALRIPDVAPDHQRSVRALAPGHAAPALPHPIRPPIG
jgi:hypothetical protein